MAAIAEREALKVSALQAVPDVDLAYAAGIIDGEGSLVITRRTTRQTYHAQITVSMCEPQAITFLFTAFGGHVMRQRVQHPGRPEHRPADIWGCAAKEAAHVCRVLLPFLRVKRQQALNVIELQQIHAKITKNTNLQRASRHGKFGPARKGRFQVDPQLLCRCEELKKSQNELNRRGNKLHEVAAQIPKAASAATPIKAEVLNPNAEAA
jgi:hypothetical protein